MRCKSFAKITLSMLSICSIVSSPTLAMVSASEKVDTNFLTRSEFQKTSLSEAASIEELESNMPLLTYLEKIAIKATTPFSGIVIEEELDHQYQLQVNQDEETVSSIDSKNSKIYTLLIQEDTPGIELILTDTSSEQKFYFYVDSVDVNTGKIEIAYEEEQRDTSVIKEDTAETDSSLKEDSDAETTDKEIEAGTESDSEDLTIDPSESTEDEEPTTDTNTDINEETADTPSADELDKEETKDNPEEDKTSDSEKQTESIKMDAAQKAAVLKTDTITSKKSVGYYATIGRNNEGIYTNPKGTANALLVTSYLFNGQNVKVTEEATTTSGTFAKLTLDKDKKVIGWINKKDLDIQYQVNSSKKVDYYVTVKNTNGGVFTLPREVFGSKLLTSYLYNGFDWKVYEEATTNHGTYVQLTNIGTNQVTGWININDINVNKDIINRNNVEYYGKVKIGNSGIYTQPSALKGAVLVTSYVYNNQDVKITEEMTVLSGVYVKLINLKTSSIIGWMNKKDLSVYPGIGQVTNVDYNVVVKAGNSGIHTLPKGIFGAVLVTSYLYDNQELAGVQETTTPEGTFVKMAHKTTGKEIGWINKKDVNVVQYITSTKTVDYDAVVLSSNKGIYTKPKGVSGSRLVTSYVYNGVKLHAVEEAVTTDGIFVKLTDRMSGKEIGWILKNGLSISENNFKRYNVTVRKGNDGIYTLPKVIDGAILVTSYLYDGQRFEVAEEYQSGKDTYLKLVQMNTGVFIGWINKKGTNNQRTVFIDPGHGGTDPGAQYYGVNEKEINLQVAKVLQGLLEERGYSVIMARTTDVSLDFKTERSRLANASNADIFVSVHHNAMPGNSTAHGIETYFYKYDPDYPPVINGAMHNDPTRILESSKLANAIHSSLIVGTGAFDRGVRTETFAVLRETAIPAVLLELGYMSNPSENQNLTSANYQKKLATAVVQGIDNYFN